MHSHHHQIEIRVDRVYTIIEKRILYLCKLSSTAAVPLQMSRTTTYKGCYFCWDYVFNSNKNHDI